VLLRREGDRLLARAPDALAGLIEVRSIGIVSVAETCDIAEVALIVDLVAPAEVERMPDPQQTDLLGLTRPLVRLAPFEASAPVKLAVALALAAQR
jgi:HPr kinase/phosphorylase